MPFGGRRDLDHHVAPGDAFVESPCRLLGARFVVGEAGIDLDADEPVDSARLVVDRLEDLSGPGDVLEHHRPVVGDRGVLVEGEDAELLVVVGGPLDRLLEDRRVRRQPADALVAKLDELARREIATTEVVEPRTLVELLVQADQSVHGFMLRRGGAERPRPRGRRGRH